MSRYYGGMGALCLGRGAARSRPSGKWRNCEEGRGDFAGEAVEGRRSRPRSGARRGATTWRVTTTYENRLPRGRTYVRNGSVVDLQIAPHEVTAMVSGSSIYTVKITIGEVAKAQWKSICADCSGGIDSLVELLQGRFSKGVMERICRQGTGLFPKPSEIRFSCSCPDYASMCKHVAAALYGVGARLDAEPELLFRLRAVNENDLVADIGKVLPMAKQGPASGKVLEADDIAALFGLDMGEWRGASGGRCASARSRRSRRFGRRPRMRAAVRKTASAKKAARAGVTAASEAEPKPVEWWKPAPPKQVAKVRVSTRDATRPTAERKFGRPPEPRSLPAE